MSDAANRLARVLREQIQKADAKDVDGRIRVAEVVGTSPLLIQPMGGKLSFSEGDLIWSNTSLQTRDQWDKGDTVILARAGNAYIVVDALNVGEVLGGTGGGGGPVVAALDDLTDVDVDPVATDDVLVKSVTDWVAKKLTDANFAAANVDGTPSTPSLRTLGAGAQQAAQGNHTHVIGDTTDLQAALDAKAALSHNHAIADVVGLDDALDAKLDAAQFGSDGFHNVRALTVANINIASPGTTIDGLTMAVGDRVFLYSQSTVMEIGIWVWNGASVPMTRPADWANGSTIRLGEFIYVERGTYGSIAYRTTNEIVVGTNQPTFARVWVTNTTAESVSGAKTFTSHVTLPGSDPTADNHAARKSYVDAVTNRLGKSIQHAAATADTYYLIGTLPTSSASTYDKLLVEAFGGGYVKDQTHHIEVLFSRREGFDYAYRREGAHYNTLRIVAYEQADGSVSIYAKHVTGYFTSGVVRAQGINITGEVAPNIIIDAGTTTVPSGTLVFDSYTTTPNTALHVGSLTADGNTVWHAGNDGAGSGLDADTVDGQHASAFATAAHNHVAADVTDFDTQVRTNKIHDLALPTAATPMNGQGFTGLGDLQFAGNPRLMSSAGSVLVSADGSYLYLSSKAAIQHNDAWLRLNPTGAFTSGIYCGTGVLRTDGIFSVGSEAGTNPSMSVRTWPGASTYKAIYGGLSPTASNYSIILPNATDRGLYLNSLDAAINFRINNVTQARIDASGILLEAGKKVQQSAAPTVGNDLTNKTYVDAGDAALDTRLDAIEALGDLATQAELDAVAAAKANATHTHVIGDTTDLQAALDGKAAASHLHAIGDVTGLQAALDTKLATAGGNVSGHIVSSAAYQQSMGSTAAHGLQSKLTTDTTFRAHFGLDTSDRGAIELGPGGSGARDWKLYRNGANSAQLASGDTLDATLGALTAPTRTAGDSTTHVATTAFVQAALGTYLTQSAGDARYLQLSGGTLTGAITTKAITAHGNIGAKKATDTDFRTLLDDNYPRLMLGAGNAPLDWILERTAANEATLGAGDVLRLDTMPEGDASTAVANTEYVDRATGNASSARPFAKARNSVAQSIPNGTWTALTFNTEASDNDGMVNLGSSTSRFTVATPGNYSIVGSVYWTNSGAGQRGIRIARLRGGATTYFNEVLVAGASMAGMHPTADIIECQTGDQVWIEVYQSTGAALNTIVNAAYELNTLSMAWVGGTGAAWGNAGARVYNSADQTIPGGGVATALTFNSEAFDIDGMHSTSVNPSRLTCTIPGTYIIEGRAQFKSTSASGYTGVGIYKNGVQDAITISDDGENTLEWPQRQVVSVVQMNVGDYVELYAIQDMGVGNVAVGNQHFSAVRVGYQTNPAGETSWQAPSYTAGWSDYDTTTYGPVQYRKTNGGMVILKGLAARTAAGGSVAFTLPAGFRPNRALIFTVRCHDNTVGETSHRIDVSPAGVVEIQNVGGRTLPWVSFSQIQFYAEQ